MSHLVTYAVLPRYSAPSSAGSPVAIAIERPLLGQRQAVLAAQRQARQVSAA